MKNILYISKLIYCKFKLRLMSDFLNQKIMSIVMRKRLKLLVKFVNIILKFKTLTLRFFAGNSKYNKIEFKLKIY